jgi:hypothetical protein
MTPCAALAAQHLLPGEGDDIELGKVEVLREGRRGGIADRQALAIGRDEIGIRNAHAGGGAVPGEDHVAVEIDGGKIRQLAVAGFDLARVLELQLLDRRRSPTRRRSFPRRPCRPALAEQRPQRHLDGAGIGSGHDADAVVRRHFQNFAGEIDGLLSAWPCRLGAVRTAERPHRQVRSSDQPGRFEQGPEGEMGIIRTHVRRGRGRHDASILPDRKLLVGEECPAAGITGSQS